MVAFLLLSIVLVGAVSAAKPGPRLDIPILVSPNNGEVLSSHYMTLEWSPVTGATIYYFEVDCRESGSHLWIPEYDDSTTVPTEPVTLDSCLCAEPCDARWRVAAGSDGTYRDSKASKYSYFTFVTTCLPGDTFCTSGCENLQTDPNNCGSCGTVCPAVANGVPACAFGMCSVGSCSGDYLDCDGIFTNGCETDTTTDEANCGACGTACSADNGVGFCNVGSCALDTCNTGFADCDGEYYNGCEIDTTTPENCGSCGNTCDLSNVDGHSCSGTTCLVDTCDAGFAHCDSDDANGCEINTDTDPDNCGECWNECSVAGGSASYCDFGQCVIQCDPGWGDCDSYYENGCETNTYEDPNNCGGCSSSGFAALAVGGIVCSVTDGSASCTGGACTIASCDPGLEDCDYSYETGCETNTDTDPDNCGYCGTVCQPGEVCSTQGCILSS
jgi:hypothetical protein